MRRDWDCAGGGGGGGGGGGAFAVPGVVVEVADCGVASQREERSEELMKASMTEELSSVHRFIRYSVIPCTNNNVGLELDGSEVWVLFVLAAKRGSGKERVCVCILLNT